MMTSLRQPMLQYLKVAEMPNIKEACGILKWFAGLKATASTEQLMCCMEVLRWMQKHHIETKFKDKFDVVKPGINATLLKVLENARKQGCKPTEFLRLYKDEVSLLLPKTALEVVTRHAGEWLDVEPELQELVSSSGLGMQLFGFAIKQTLNSTVRRELDSQLDLLKTSDTITSDLILKTSKNMQASLKLIPNVEAIPEKRIIEAITDQGGRGE
jgi:hypothetical protein